MKHILPLLCFLLSSMAGYSAVFEVTSNLDSGLGTLREAIEKANANGTNETDYIYFNLAGNLPEDHIITLESALPPLTGDLVIDGSTQPGNTYGLSGAKVIVCFQLAEGSFLRGLDLSDASNVSIYGLQLKYDSHNSYYSGHVAIYCSNSKNITIGAPGKGNLITGWGTAIGGPYGEINDIKPCKNILIQSNIMGLTADGESINYSSYKNYPRALNIYGIYLEKIKNVQIGGLTEDERNIINATGYCVYLNHYDSKPGYSKIINNRIGTDYYGKKSMTTDVTNLSLIEVYMDNIEIINNQLMGSGHHVGIDLWKSDHFVIQGNIINADYTGKSKSNSNLLEGIVIEFSNNGLIGGSRPGQGNIIAFTEHTGGIFSAYSKGNTISQNSIFCNNFKGIYITSWPFLMDNPPFIHIHHQSTSHIDGNALPYSVIELFYDDDCPNCEGKTYFTTVKADADGYWRYDGALDGNVVATATSVDGSTSEFSTPLVSTENIRITNSGCGKKNGAIKGLSILSGASFHWEDENGNIVGKDTVLKNVGPGKYRFVISNGMNENMGCQTVTDFIVVEESTPQIISDNILLKAASCGQRNGAIMGLRMTGKNLKIEWKNERNKVVGTTANLRDVAPGKYTIFLTDTLNHCIAESGPFLIQNEKGPVIDLGTMILTDATCSNDNGSIQQIQVKGSGELQLAWINQDNMQVGNTVNLTNVPKGKYILRVQDQSGCPAVESDSFTIADKGSIHIDLEEMQIQSSNCNNNTGSVTGIQVDNGDTYTWFNEDGNPVAQTTSLDKVGAGKYYLYVSNTEGCTAKTRDVSVPEATPPKMSVYQITTIPPTCNKKNGVVKDILIVGGNPVTYQWKDSKGDIISNQKTLKGIGPGKYDLYVTGKAGCEQLVTSATLYQPPLPVIDEKGAIVTGDHCGSRNGSVKGIILTGEAPFNYTWIDNNNRSVGTRNDLEEVPAGSYQLLATDRWGCKVSSGSYEVRNEDIPLEPPSYKDVTIMMGMDVSLKADNPDIGRYYLYRSLTDPVPLYNNATGIFTIPNIKQSTTFFIERQYGHCKSARTEVHIQVIKGIKVFVPTAFSPNGDGQNDVFRFITYGLASIDYFNVYNRWGALVFHAKDPSKGWDGTMNGEMQPIGAYVWAIRGKGINGEVIEQHGVVTLIR